MGTENSAWWSLLGAAEGRTECLAVWDRHFAGGAKTLRRFCIPTGAPAEFYPHPSGGLDLVIERDAAGGFRAVCPETGADDWVPPIGLAFEDVQGYTFDLKGVAEELCARCGITADWRAEGGYIYRLGPCGVKSAYAYFGPVADASVKIASFMNRQRGTAGCVMVPHEAYDTTAELVDALGVATVPLSACFKITANGIKGSCGKRCLASGRKTATERPVPKSYFYVVNNRFRIEGDFSKVTTLVSKYPPWQLQPFTKMILKVLLLDCNHTGLTGAEIYERAKAAFEVQHPESRTRERGQELYPAYASLIQFFRVQRKKKKRPHLLYRELTLSGKKPTVYSYDGKVVKHEASQLASDIIPDKI